MANFGISRLPRFIATAVVPLSLSIPSVSGQVLLSPVAVTLGANLGTYSEEITPAINMINQSALTPTFVSGVTLFSTYFNSPNASLSGSGNNAGWTSETSFSPPIVGDIDFDLGATYRITKLAIWNATVKDLDVTIFETLPGTGQPAGSFTLVNHASFISFPADLLDFGNGYQGRYIRLTPKTQFPLFPGATFGYVIINEVAAIVLPANKPPTVAISFTAAGDVVLAFDGVLQQSSRPQGPFLDVPGATKSPHTFSREGTAGPQFFRARAQ